MVKKSRIPIPSIYITLIIRITHNIYIYNNRLYIIVIS